MNWYVYIICLRVSIFEWNHCFQAKSKCTGICYIRHTTQVHERTTQVYVELVLSIVYCIAEYTLISHCTQFLCHVTVFSITSSWCVWLRLSSSLLLWLYASFHHHSALSGSEPSSAGKSLETSEFVKKLFSRSLVLCSGPNWLALHIENIETWSKTNDWWK